MTLLQRLTAPVLIAALSVASLTVTAAEWAPVRLSSTVVAPAELSARVIVKYKADAAGRAKILSAAAGTTAAPQQAQALGTRLGLTLADGRGLDNQTQLVHASGISSAALAQRLAQDASVEWAVPDRRMRARMVPNDPRFGAGQASPYPAAGQWYLRAPDTSAGAAINAVGAWDSDSTLGANQVVAVLDTGITTHEDLAGSRFLSGYNMVSLNTISDGVDAKGKCITGNLLCRTAGAMDPGDWVSLADQKAHPTLFGNTCLAQTMSGTYVDSPSSWHGTQVAGIVGAETNNNIGVAGIASGAKILPVRVLGKCGGWDSDIIDGMRWAAGLTVAGVPANPNPARVINLSLGGAGACGSAYQSAIDEILSQKQVVIVVAAGNEGLAVGAPANCKGVVAVAGVRHFGTKVGYSSLGPEVTLAAPAGNCVNTTGGCLMPILTTLNDGATVPGNAIYSDSFSNISLGTSFAAPQVSGTAALMLAANARLTSTQVSSMLGLTARPFPRTGAPDGAGAGAGGVVQDCKAPSLVAQDSECYCTATTCGAGMLDANAAVAMAVDTPTASISAAPASPQAGQTVALDASGSVAGGGRSIPGNGYLWEITSGASIAKFTSATNAATATVDTSGAGTVTVRLTVTDSGGKLATASQTFTVGGVTFTAAISAAPSAPVVGSSVTLDSVGSVVAAGRSVSGYLWEITSGGTLASFSGSTAASTATLLASAAGSVTVKLTLTDSEGLQTSGTKTLTIASASSGGGGGAWSPLWSLGLLLATAALPARRRLRG